MAVQQLEASLCLDTSARVYVCPAEAVLEATPVALGLIDSSGAELPPVIAGFVSGAEPFVANTMIMTSAIATTKKMMIGTALFFMMVHYTTFMFDWVHTKNRPL